MRHTYLALLVSLLVTLIAAPVVSAAGGDGRLVELFLIVNLATAAIGVPEGKARSRLLLILAAAGVLRLAGMLLHSEATSDVASAIWIALAIAAALRAFRFALSARAVDSEQICAALAVYMLAGLFYGLAYWKLETVWSGSFTMPNAASGPFDLPSAIYLSFVTVATVGFGDIVPSNPVSRGLVITEAILGQFYMVVLVARLVSLYSASRDPNPR